MNLNNLKSKDDAPIADEAAEIQKDHKVVAVAQYTSHPVMNYRVGTYQFTNGLLSLYDAVEAEAFATLHAKLPASEKSRIKLIDVEGAEKIAKAFKSTTQSSGVATSESPIT